MATRCLSRLAASMLVAGLLCGPAVAQQIAIYPSKGQSQEQQDKDRYECNNWAVRQAGFNPSTAYRAQAPVPPPPYYEAPQGGVIRGAARGAAIGAIGGAFGGKAGKGAKIGAATGALFGGIRRHDQRVRQSQQQRAYEAQVAQIQAQHQARLAAGQDAYNRAMASSLEPRGYTVN